MTPAGVRARVRRLLRGRGRGRAGGAGAAAGSAGPARAAPAGPGPARVRGADAETLLAAARADWAAGRRDRAQDALRRALVLLPGRADLWFLHAQRAVEAGRPDAALDAVRTALDLHPAHVGAVELLIELARVRNCGHALVRGVFDDLAAALPAHPAAHRGAVDLLIPARHRAGAAALAAGPDPVARAAARLWLHGAGEPAEGDPLAGLEPDEARLAEAVVDLACGRVRRAVDLVAALPADRVPVDALRRAVRRQLAAGRPARAAVLLGEYRRARPADAWGRRTQLACRRAVRAAEAGAEPSNAQLARRGFPVARRAAEPAYEPHPRRLLYLLHNSLPYASAGYATRSHGLLRGLAADWDVLGVTRPGFPFDLPGHDELRSVPAREVVDGVPYARLSTEPGVWPKNPLTRYVADYADAVADLARRERPALVHAASNHWNGLTAVQAARRLGLPSVYEVRGLWEVTRASRNPGWAGSGMYRYIARMEADAATAADRVIAITEGLRAELVGRGVPEDRITVVPNGVDTRRFVPVPRDADLAERLGLAGRTVIGYVGSMLDYEGIDLLVRAAAELDRERSDFHVLLVGDGAERERFEALADELGVLGRVVTFVGRVPHADVERYYSLVDVAPFPRLPLPVCELVSPLKPFEAMAAGKAVVASDVAALAEIVDDGVTGLLHAKGDAADLARRLRELLDRPDLVRRLGAAGRAWVERERDWATLAGRVSALYEELGAGRAAAVSAR
ncbi:glycosyltransferase [Cellulomonas sp.]|uniref:glycosyltransferase n=1 Tax=Cellulomonas sp. TaxID=40001 RepID=UPI002D2F2CE8|nr:glycosyltransferase [Cellulomonas sp.]HYQ76636.1 glycosyltransferase [Cellulomonas sp.]